MLKEEGKTWRIINDKENQQYPFVIGGPNWAIEISQNNWKDLYYLVQNLSKEYKCIEKNLMDDESILIELTRKTWWGCIKGFKNNWILKIVFSGDTGEKSDRGFEITWDKKGSQEFCNAMRKMWESNC